MRQNGKCVSYKKHQPYWTKERLIKLGQKVYRQLGYFPTFTDFQYRWGGPSLTPIKNLFGSYKKFVEACGLSYNLVAYVKQNRWTKEKLIVKGKQLYDQLGYVPDGQTFHKQHGGPNYHVIDKLFGSYWNFISACEPHELVTRKLRVPEAGPPYWTREEMIVKGQEAYNQLGFFPHHDDFHKKHGGPERHLIVRVFGGYKNFALACGVNYRQKWRNRSRTPNLPKYLRWYLAGIIDAEAYVGINAQGMGMIQIINTNREWLEYIQQLCKAGTLRKVTNYLHWKPNHKQIYRLDFGVWDSYELAKQIKDLVKVKKDKIEQLIKVREDG